MEVFSLGKDKAFWHISQQAPGADNWSNWQSLGVPAAGTQGASTKVRQRQEVASNSEDVVSLNLQQSTEQMMNGAAINN
ncbi:hypothetical protein [Hymenobacter volaticus]|uniref:PLL-like beta propeller domain-containing protein n=1 Tax=Hymenobacter volaticus TaxID=2932254 RepID=A0ABY4GFD1_9BACT|nr:hypothetical protein [Hymenobacter volaticus]UOQ69640.1 hypothetical protein MUN86_29525 [Hymenobacter volaticus]